MREIERKGDKDGGSKKETNNHPLSLVTIIISLVMMLLAAFPAFAGEEITFLFTSDIHDYLYPTVSKEQGEIVEHGGAARLKTLLDESADENTIYIDGGDFSMGTLIQAAYSTEAYELRNLGIMGCAVTTFGNHEFDYGATGVADMLRAAKASGDSLPAIVQSNIDFSGKLTTEQQELKAAFDEYGVKPYFIRETGGVRIGFFGLVGHDCIECIQTDLNYIDYIDAAREMVKALEAENCDVIVALSHSGTESETEGEDIELAKAVPDIDIILSGHTHSIYDDPIRIGDTVIVAGSEYLKAMGRLKFTVDGGKVTVTDYEMSPINSSVKSDKETESRIDSYKEKINESYLAEENVTFDQVIAHSNFDLIGLNEMYDTHQEYTVGNLIADSYIYEAQQNGIDDIDVALVGLGTIRSSIREGNITTADAFEICSLGVGADGSAGHPIAAVYITGEELKLLTELDASLGELVSSIKMSYSGLSYKFNTRRPILDRVTMVELVRPDGTREAIEDDKLYKVCANMYAGNMLGMLNGLTKGILSITPKNADGEPIDDLYEYSLINKDGKEIKEWVAFKNYLMSFEKNADGISEIPSKYEDTLGRKLKYAAVDIKEMLQLGTATNILSKVNIIGTLVIAMIVVIIVLIIKRRKKRKNKGPSAPDVTDTESAE